MSDVVVEKDVIDRQFNSWWRNCWPFGNEFTQASDYANAAYRAGYLAAQDIVMSNSAPVNAVPAKTPKIGEILTRDQRDALVAANVFLSVMQAADTELFNRLQGVIDEISDMLYEE